MQTNDREFSLLFYVSFGLLTFDLNTLTSRHDVILVTRVKQ